MALCRRFGEAVTTGAGRGRLYLAILYGYRIAGRIDSAAIQGGCSSDAACSAERNSCVITACVIGADPLVHSVAVDLLTHGVRNGLFDQTPENATRYEVT